MKKGFTLIEILLYVTIASSLIFTLSFFTGTLSEARVKSQTIAEVQEQGMYIAQIMTRVALSSVSINTPVMGASAPSLSLATSDATSNPTVFEIGNGVLYMRQGAGPQIALTNSHVEVSDLSFENLSPADTSGVLKIGYTVSYINPGRYEYTFSKKFQTAITLRDNQ